MTEIDDITMQLARAAGRALHAARSAVERSRQHTAQQREELRREREHRMRALENQLRTTILERRLADREGNRQLVAELAEIEGQQRTDELIAQWAAAEAMRATEPDVADAWTTRLEEAGIDPEVARARADELAYHPWEVGEMSENERLAADFADMATDIAENRGATEEVDDIVGHEGAETERLINLAHPDTYSIGPAATPPITITPPGQAVDLEHVPQL